MKTEELIELLPPNDSLLNSAMRKFEVAAPVLCRDAGYCKQLLDEGWMQPLQINWRGIPAYLITWHITSDRGFWLDIAQTLNAGAPFEVLVGTVENLAREKGCRYVRYLTVRRGLVWLGQQLGYTPEAALLTKVL